MQTTRGPRAVRGGALLRTGAALTTCAVLGAVVAQARTDPPARFDLQGGGAWVASATVGQMTLIDGGSAEVVARVAVGSPGGDLRSAQFGRVGYGVDRDRGTIARIDPATFVAAPPVAVIEGARGEVTVHPTRDLVYVVDHRRGRVGVTDETAVASLRGEVQSLAEPVVSSVVDGGGRLWTLGRATGDLTWFDGTERHSRRAVAADPTTAELVTIAGEPAIVERGGRTVRTIDSDGGISGETCLEIDPADPSVAVGGSARAARLYVVSGDDGLLRVSDLGDGRCGDVAVEVARPARSWGRRRRRRGTSSCPTSPAARWPSSTSRPAGSPTRASWWRPTRSSSCSPRTGSCSTTTRPASGPGRLGRRHLRAGRQVRPRASRRGPLPR